MIHVYYMDFSWNHYHPATISIIDQNFYNGICIKPMRNRPSYGRNILRMNVRVITYWQNYLLDAVVRAFMLWLNSEGSTRSSPRSYLFSTSSSTPSNWNVPLFPFLTMLASL
ncbi:hypothetical protein RsoM2USA_414 [Ralstonia phage RsoM2USA]|nr:hypothetical protein RsoM2USA_414 [Ralstonia phage RsoM2USA]